MKLKIILITTSVLLLALWFGFTQYHPSTSAATNSAADQAKPSLSASRPQSRSGTDDHTAVQVNPKTASPPRTFVPIGIGEKGRLAKFPLQKIDDFFGDFIFPISPPGLGDQYLKNQFANIFGANRYGQDLASDGNYYTNGNLSIYPDHMFFMILSPDYDVLAAMTITPCSSMVASGVQLAKPCTDEFATFYFKQGTDKQTEATYRQGLGDWLNYLASGYMIPGTYPAYTVRIP